MAATPTLALTAALCLAAPAPEGIWIEAENLAGIRGYCWPMGKPEMKKTAGHWGLSGPGWAAEWTQGGESGFLSIACGADDDQAAATAAVEIPVAGRWFVWVRFRDNREKGSRFQVRLEQPGAPGWSATYGTRPVVEEDNELKLYWDWAFAWEGHAAELRKGPANLTLLSAFKEAECRQIDCLVLTTDPTYRPRVKERPRHPTWDVLDGYRQGLDGLAPLARRAEPLMAVPAAWKPRTFRDQGFRYLWNVGETAWAGDDPKRVPVPYHVGDPEARKAFEARYAGKADVPIFGDPRIVPTLTGTGPAPALEGEPSGRFRRWLDDHPDRFWAALINYQPDTPLSPAGREAFFKYRDRFVGRISGENLGYFALDPKATAEAAKTGGRRELAAALGDLAKAANAAKWQKVFGPDAAKLGNPYAETIPCLSADGLAYLPLVYQSGARAAGIEATGGTGAMLGLRWAFLRGAARQWDGLTATYRSCNFGDAATIFSNQSTYSKPGNILENFYSVYSGAGMTWYKMDLWYQYLAGSSFFYHEQGFDEFWIPGGTSYGPSQLQLSPKGKLVDRFLRVTAQHPDRGTPVTPVAFLVDHAHGWDPLRFASHPFGPHGEGAAGKGRPADHEDMLQAYFWAAFHPIGPKSQEPVTATNEAFVPGVFGDIFDVVYAYPDVGRWAPLDRYPVAVAAGELPLTAAEGARLAKYVEDGGTLLVADGQLTGPGAAALGLPAPGPAGEAAGYRWLEGPDVLPAQTFRFRAVPGGRPLATAPDGAPICAAFERGKGRLIVLGVPWGLGIDRQAVPPVARLLAHLTRGLMPVTVGGEVEWLVNKTADGWLVLLLNPAGQRKPQQGIFPTDHGEARAVTITAPTGVKSAADWLAPTEPLSVQGGAVRLEVPAGGVRVVELR